MRKKLLYLLLVSSLTASTTMPYFNLQTFYTDKHSNLRLASTTNNSSGITVIKSDTTVTIKDTVSNSLDNNYLTSQNFSTEQLSTISSATTLIFECTENIKILNAVIQNNETVKQE